jgi:hypothetical protein
MAANVRPPFPATGGGEADREGGRAAMSRGLMKSLGILLLLATVGVVSCQGLFADRAPVDRLDPPAAGQR